MTRTPIVLSPKQRDAITADQAEQVLVGSVRSGKSHAAAIRFCNRSLQQEPGDYMHLVTGRSPLLLKSEILPHLQTHCSRLGVSHSWNGADRILHAGGHRFWLAAYSNQSSVDRIMSATAGNILCDEASLVSLDFWRGLHSRMTFDWSTMTATCNPKGPGHWLKKEIDKGRVADWTFTFRDNPTLKPATIRRFETMYPTGSVHYKRFVLGQWAAAEGVIWCDVPTGPPPPGSHKGRFAGIDFGKNSPSSLVVVDQYDIPGESRYHVVESLHIEGEAGVSIHPHEQALRMKACWERRPFQVAYIDRTQYGLAAGLQELIPQCSFQPSDSDVIEGINVVDRLFASRHLTIAHNEATRPLRDEIAEYVWTGHESDDKPVKLNDHSCDALRYAVVTHLGRLPAVVI